MLTLTSVFAQSSNSTDNTDYQTLAKLYPGLDNPTLEKIANFSCYGCTTHDQILAKWVSIFPDGSMVPVVILFEGQPSLDEIKANKTIDYTGDIELVKSYGGNVTKCFSSLLRGCGANMPKDRVFDLEKDSRVTSIDANTLGRTADILPNPRIIWNPHFDNSTDSYNSTSKKIAYYDITMEIGKQSFLLKDTVEFHLTALQPPLKQNVATSDIKCKQGFFLMLKKENSSPACVSGDTERSLIKRGWGVGVTRGINGLTGIVSNLN
ncbi:MAG TPA: hypothetical protein VLT10_00200 [Verrucomicrobiae bacterium]|nr:hypothetical protein [Verrucomicrobiae bacterium]